jgi:hypothetical protein
MAATALSSTTLSAAITASQREFSVASGTGITAGTLLQIRDETMEVLSITGTYVLVRRGVSSSARAHPAGNRVYFGAASAFKATRDGAAALLGDSGSLPDYLFPGKRMRDGAGNEYVLCDLTGTVYSQTPVQINSDYTAAKVGITGRGAFGVAAEPGTSDQWAWIQIYGRALIQLLGATAEVSPSDAANGPTTLSTTAQTKFWLPTTATSSGPEGIRWTSGNTSTTSGFYVEGLTVATDASPGDVSGTTAATSHTGSRIGVFLNYPRIVHLNVGE